MKNYYYIISNGWIKYFLFQKEHGKWTNRDTAITFFNKYRVRHRNARLRHRFENERGIICDYDETDLVKKV